MLPIIVVATMRLHQIVDLVVMAPLKRMGLSAFLELPLI